MQPAHEFDVCDEPTQASTEIMEAYELGRLTRDQRERYLDLLYVLEAQCLADKSVEQERILRDTVSDIEKLAGELK
ncbi:MAG: hypothetical protein IPL86_16085 [Flavobacteriales bacterium]|nr:hypothetical protein [Flavobacteriales bacterium]